MSDQRERDIAIRDAHQADAEEQYFSARPDMIDVPARRRVFGAGFRFAWDHLAAQLAAAQARLAEIEAREPTYLFRRRGQTDFCTCDKRRYLELSEKPKSFEVKKLYARPVAPAAEPAPNMIDAFNGDAPMPEPSTPDSIRLDFLISRGLRVVDHLGDTGLADSSGGIYWYLGFEPREAIDTAIKQAAQQEGQRHD